MVLITDYYYYSYYCLVVNLIVYVMRDVGEAMIYGFSSSFFMDYGEL